MPFVAVNAMELVRNALAGSGVELVASCPIATYDASAPEALRSAALMPGARGVIVAGSAGPHLWRAFRAMADADPPRWRAPHPYDAFVGSILSRADRALADAGVASRRFEAAFQATPRLDMLALSRLVGFGSPGPFLMHIHSVHGPWWALRGAWLVDADVDPPLAHTPPCAGCPAPCVGGWDHAGGVALATAATRARCIVGVASKYDDDQIAYHYDRAATVRRLAPAT